jgi:hypothetical protein
MAAPALANIHSVSGAPGVHKLTIRGCDFCCPAVRGYGRVPKIFSHEIVLLSVTFGDETSVTRYTSHCKPLVTLAALQVKSVTQF